MGRVHEMWGMLEDRRRKGGYKRKQKTMEEKRERGCNVNKGR
jgi:hypothetical protein